MKFDIEALYVALDRQRRDRRITWRAVGRECGLENQTALMTEIGRGRKPSVDNLVRILAWLGTTDLKPFIATDPEGQAE
jgi:hypothetical protein